MKRIICFLLMIALVALGLPAHSAQAAATTVTVMMYIDGSDLETDDGAATTDINEMLYADLGMHVNVILCVGGTTKWQNSVMNPDTNEYYRIDHGQFILIKDAGLQDMTRPETLTEFITYTAQNYPADRYMLVMWDHGGGAMYGFGLDDRFGANRMMSVTEMGQAIADAGVHFDFIGFDACMMATAEVAAALMDSADYLIASEEMEPGVGWYYTTWLESLAQYPDVATLSLGRYIIDQFMQKALQSDPYDILTMSMIDLDVFQDRVLPLLWRFSADTSKLIDDGSFAQIARARSAARSFGEDEYDQIDLMDFASRIGTDSATALMEALSDAIVYNKATRNMEGSAGLGIYFPYKQLRQLSGMMTTYQNLAFDQSYLSLIGSFASVQASGQYSAELASSDWYNEDTVSSQVQYLADHQFSNDQLQVHYKDDGYYALTLTDDDWALIVDMQLQVYVDDGEGYIDLGSDDEYIFDEDGDLIVDFDGTWISIDGITVPYYAEDYVEDGDYFCYTGSVPITYNGRDADLIICWDSEHEGGGYVRGARLHSSHGGASARGIIPLRKGDHIRPVCHYYTYDGEYDGDYLFGDGYVYGGSMTVSYAPIGYDEVAFCYMLVDIYGNSYWTEYIFR